MSVNELEELINDNKESMSIYKGMELEQETIATMALESIRENPLNIDGFVMFQNYLGIVISLPDSGGKMLQV